MFKCLLSHPLSVLQVTRRGFMKGRSAVTQLLCFLHEVGSSLDKGHQTDVVYLDFSKAFDSVNHI